MLMDSSFQICCRSSRLQVRKHFWLVIKTPLYAEKSKGWKMPRKMIFQHIHLWEKKPIRDTEDWARADLSQLKDCVIIKPIVYDQKLNLERRGA